MRYSKLFITIIIFSCTRLSSQIVYAQDALEKRQKALKENNEQLNRVYENNLPNRKGTTYSALTPAEIEASWNGGKTMSEKERYNAEHKTTRELIYDEESGKYLTPGSPQWVSLTTAQLKMMDALMHTLAEKKHIYLTDKLEWYKDTYFISAMPDYYKLKPLDYNAASEAVLTFTQINSTASYQSLYDLVWKARILPLSARNMILFLHERFPHQQKKTELLELKQLPYFFGASRPYINHRWANLKDYKKSPYPGSFYEYTNTTSAMRNEVLQRFVELAGRYPEEGLIAAGFCRSHLNPFTLYAQTNTDLTDAQKEDLYWKAIHIKRSLTGVDEGSIGVMSYPFGGTDFVFLLFKKPLTWLIEKREDRIKNLSPADWTEISDRTAASIRDISAVRIYAQRKYQYEDIILFRKYKNFKKAYETWDKGIEKAVKEGERKERRKN